MSMLEKAFGIDLDRLAVLDIETTVNKDPMQIRLVGIKWLDEHTHPHYSNFQYGNADYLIYLLKDLGGYTLITWNGQRFDIPHLLNYWGVDIIKICRENNIRLIDGMILEKIIHSLDYEFSLVSTADRYKIKHDAKSEVTDLEWYNTASLPELYAYMIKDLGLTMKVFMKQVECLTSATMKALEVEMAVADIVQKQVERGVCFNLKESFDLVAFLQHRKDELAEQLTEMMPWVDIPEAELDYPPTKQFLKAGTPSVNMYKWAERNGVELLESKDGWVVVKGADLLSMPILGALVTFRKLDFNKAKQLKDYFLDCGWTPEWKTDKGSPIIFNRDTGEIDESLEALGIPWIPEFKEYNAIKSRLNNLTSPNGWLCQAKESFEGLYPVTATPSRIHVLSSDADTCGTPTFRFRHKSIVNVPRVSSFLGKELRSLFTARPGYKMVGWDADSLEACMEAHYCYPIDASYSEALISGRKEDGTDVHSRNVRLLGLADRDQAKKFKYMVTYGAQPRKIALSMGCTLSQASLYYDDFWAANNALKQVRDSCINMHKRQGYVPGLDGRRIYTRSEHSALNSLFQGAGAVTMKYAMIIADKMIHDKFGSDAAGLIRMHDEEQWEAKEFIAEEVGKIGVQSITLAGKYLGLNVPLSGTYTIGNNWAETH